MLIYQWYRKSAFVSYFICYSEFKKVVFTFGKIFIRKGKEEQPFLMFVLHKYPLSIDGGTILAYPTEIVFDTDLELVKLAYIILYLGEVQRRVLVLSDPSETFSGALPKVFTLAVSILSLRSEPW